MTEQEGIFTDLADIEEISTIVEASKDGIPIVFKHSATCPISAEAHDEMVAFAEEYDGDVYRVIVQDSRDLCKAIAEEFDVPHQSPQILVIRDGECVWETSHEDVTQENVSEALSHIRS